LRLLKTVGGYKTNFNNGTGHGAISRLVFAVNTVDKEPSYFSFTKLKKCVSSTKIPFVHLTRD